MKPGTRLKSTACDTEVMVIRGSNIAVACGGVTMAEQPPAEKSPLDPVFTAGTLLGKRYVDQAGSVELLCVKPGKGSLSIEGVALQIKEAKALPSSD